MLQALELAGFKSFADKTRFEFADGITVVVGPNGSGKSNVVDAIKWTLGEQSAKSLRGKEMADVIFKGAGSGANQRPPMNTAEATIVFDNSEQRLPIDSAEVRITRRVYRSGEGEYLINGQACRLRDIRDLFRGTGVGTDAYSLIEQGKVDTLLQSSMKDRRALFEEAAGISRYKAKKVEAQRRLERVEQNLVRLGDIVEEVESRLRSVRAQAGKAQKYKECRDRLQQLRLYVGQTDWRRIHAQLDALAAKTEAAEQRQAESTAELAASEAELDRVDADLERLGQAIRQGEAEISGNRESIAARETAVELERRRIDELQEEATAARRKLGELTSGGDDLAAQAESARTALAESDADRERQREATQQLQVGLDALTRRLAQQRSEADQTRADFLDHLRRASATGNRLSACQNALESAEQAHHRAMHQAEVLDQSHDDALSVLREIEREEHGLLDALSGCESQLGQREAMAKKIGASLGQVREQIDDLERRHARALERCEVLDELEQRLDGLGSGVREFLALARRATHLAPMQGVQGIVADLIEAPVEIAALVDLALGPRAEHVILENDALFRFLAEQRLDVTGQVTLRLRPPAEIPAGRTLTTDFRQTPGVLGRADQLVRCAERDRPLIAELLGDTWLVESLDVAMRLRETQGQGIRVVARSGEILEPGSVLSIGPPATSGGLISRRSQLRMLREQIARWDGRLQQLRGEESDLERSLDAEEAEVAALVERRRESQIAAGELRARRTAALSRVEDLQRQLKELLRQRDDAAGARDQAAAKLVETQREHRELEQAVARLERELRELDEAWTTGDVERQELDSQLASARVELARLEQHTETRRGELERVRLRQEERERALADVQGRLSQAIERAAEAQRRVLVGNANLAELYLAKESLAERTVAALNERARGQQRRVALSRQAEQSRAALHEVESERHRLQLEADRLTHERETIANRLRDDYGVEIGQLEDLAEQPEGERAEIEQEIDTLRRKIQQIGAVNLDALGELEQLEERFAHLDGQYRDLQNAKDALAKIIQKINADSRRLFSETLDAIRENFRALFRKVFGGGSADIVLEPGVDILEAGIDIVATPVGKQSLGLSLLSGGERALTAVTLLLAIFQFRPSPFCVLDEVDGPLDEANIGRFVEVIRGYLDRTKFVVVTHSKKTMTAADTLYGVTMEESGVSKRVSVRFEDVSETGHISQAALDRAAEEDRAA